MKIIQRLKKWLHKEHGALIIESAFVYPIMFFVLMFLLYMGNMYYLKAKINSVVSQEAITYAARFADPNQEQFDKTIPTSNQGDTQVTKELYRYLDVFNISDYGTASDVQKSELIKEIEDTGFYAGMTPANITVETHKVHNYVVYQTYEVTVNYQLKFPIRFIFSKDVVLLNMTAHEETPVIDTSEFIRNVDMAVDYVERTETGQSILTTLDNTYARIEKFIDGEKKPDPSEAVAGGSDTGTGARYVGMKISKELYAKLRSRTPSDKIKNMVRDSATYPMHDPALPEIIVTERNELEADHIVPMKNIVTLEGFEQLTFEQQLEVLNNPINFMGLSQAANRSKQDKTYEEWEYYKKGTKDEIKVDSAFRQQMIEQEKVIAAELQKQIDGYVSQNKGGK